VWHRAKRYLLNLKISGVFGDCAVAEKLPGAGQFQPAFDHL
jgi:hypothetical protein